MVDASYNTNQLKYKLYALMALIDGTGFPISYCFIESGKECDTCAAIISWFKFLYESGLKEVKTILLDKDFAQISCEMAIWKNVNPTNDLATIRNDLPVALANPECEVDEMDYEEAKVDLNMDEYDLSPIKKMVNDLEGFEMEWAQSKYFLSAVV
ncbi:15852_t:CDS:2 [Gigaspora margarita]|uniref:15852_t:CDS:1 n=1 Tax=Gigaspora margarita TaxID=4874 RepID=A0ABN7V3S9_GIGMA|nr:15852_t:CDS:2 [Gigaspora margarita]